MAKLSKKEIQNLLDELYQSDPSLKERESDLIQLIMNMTASRPMVAIDDAFKAHLRKTLKTEAKRLASMPSAPAKASKEKATRPAMLFPFVYGAGGLVVGAVAMFFTVQSLNPSSPNIPSNNDQMMAEDQNEQGGSSSIAYLSKQAFGSLAGIFGSNEQGSAKAIPEGSEITADGNAVGMGGGGAMAMLSAPSADPSVMIERDVDGMVLYRAPKFEYDYTGEDLSLIAGELEVFRQTIKPISASTINGAIKNIDLGLVDVGTFSQTTIGDININEDRDRGYSIYISPANGMVNINQNWQRWQTDEMIARTMPAEPAAPAPILPDETLIKIANDFLNAHGIDASVYGEPIVDKRWMRYQTLEKVQGESMIAYAPDSVQVIYPFQVNGENIVDTSGMETGMTVGIQTRTKTVQYVNNLRSVQIESSNYPAITDTQKIMSYVDQGGLYGDYSGDGDIIRVELGTPTQEYVQVYHYDGTINSELLVPALVFPVINQPENYWRTHIIVPLISELIEEVERPIPMPLIEPAVMESASTEGSSGVTMDEMTDTAMDERMEESNQ